MKDGSILYYLVLSARCYNLREKTASMASVAEYHSAVINILRWCQARNSRLTR